VWRRWHETGAPLDDGEYQGGVRVGRWTLWHENGRKAREGEYRNGEVSGRWAEWNVRGERCDPEAPGARLAAEPTEARAVAHPPPEGHGPLLGGLARRT